MKIINTQTGEVREVDYYRVWELGMLYGFKWVDSMTENDWLLLVERLKDKNENTRP